MRSWKLEDISVRDAVAISYHCVVKALGSIPETATTLIAALRESSLPSLLSRLRRAIQSPELADTQLINGETGEVAAVLSLNGAPAYGKALMVKKVLQNASGTTIHAAKYEKNPKDTRSRRGAIRQARKTLQTTMECISDPDEQHQFYNEVIALRGGYGMSGAHRHKQSAQLQWLDEDCENNSPNAKIASTAVLEEPKQLARPKAKGAPRKGMLGRSYVRPNQKQQIHRYRKELRSITPLLAFIYAPHGILVGAIIAVAICYLTRSLFWLMPSFAISSVVVSYGMAILLAFEEQK